MNSKPKCSVSGCGKAAYVEVRLYDIYLSPYDTQIFDKRDTTCPYICAPSILMRMRRRHAVSVSQGAMCSIRTATNMVRRASMCTEFCNR
jgi:hypothetical protein